MSFKAEDIPQPYATFKWRGKIIGDMTHNELLVAAHEMCALLVKVQDKLDAGDVAPSVVRPPKPCPFKYVKDIG